MTTNKTTTTRAVRNVSLAAVALLGACSSNPPTPDWQLTAQQSSERAITAYLEGNSKVEQAELAHANREMARTARPDLLARLALRRCAVVLASLDQSACTSFEPYRADAPLAELAYADYLAKTEASSGGTASNLSQLPEHHRAVAAASSDAAALVAVKSIKDPLARIVAAGVVFRRNLASPELIDIAIETASQQGWRRPLLAWLKLQLLRVEAAMKTDNASGLNEQAQRLKRRIAVLQNQWPNN